MSAVLQFQFVSKTNHTVHILMLFLFSVYSINIIIPYNACTNHYTWTHFHRGFEDEPSAVLHLIASTPFSTRNYFNTQYLKAAFIYLFIWPIVGSGENCKDNTDMLSPKF